MIEDDPASRLDAIRSVMSVPSDDLDDDVGKVVAVQDILRQEIANGGQARPADNVGRPGGSTESAPLDSRPSPPPSFAELYKAAKEAGLDFIFETASPPCPVCNGPCRGHTRS